MLHPPQQRPRATNPFHLLRSSFDCYAWRSCIERRFRNSKSNSFARSTSVLIFRGWQKHDNRTGTGIVASQRGYLFCQPIPLKPKMRHQYKEGVRRRATPYPPSQNVGKTARRATWHAIRAYIRLLRRRWPRQLAEERTGSCKKLDLIKSILIAARLGPRWRRRATNRSLNIQACRSDSLKSCLWVRCCVAPGFCRNTTRTGGP